MSDLSRLEGEAWDRGYARGQQVAAARIEQLEASLAEWKALAIQWAKDNDPSSPPARQENDDVFPGFRGNNEA